MCFGFAYALALECIRGKGHSYMQKMAIIQQMCANKMNLLSFHSNDDIFDIHAFLNVIILSMNSLHTSSFLDRGLGIKYYQDFDFPNSVFNSPINGVPIIKKTIMIETTPNKLKEFINSFYQKNNNICFAFIFNIYHHTITLAYDLNKWALCNNATCYYTKNIMQVIDEIIKLLMTKNNKIHCVLQIAVNSLLTLNINCDTSNIEFDINNSKNLLKSLYFALTFNFPENVHQCMPQIMQQNLLNKNPQKHIKFCPCGGFYNALNTGNTEAVKAFFYWLEKYKYEQNYLFHIMSYGIIGLQDALYNRQASAVEAFFDGIKKLNFGAVQLFDLVFQYNVYDIILRNGDTKMIEVFLHGIYQLCCFSENFARLLRKNFDVFFFKNNKEISGIQFLLQSGKVDAVYAFFKGIQKFKFKSSNLLELFLCKSLNGTPGLHFSFQHNHIEIITTVFTIAKESLELPDLLKLLCCENAKKRSIFHIAMMYGNAEAIQTYFTIISSIKLTPEQLLNLLFCNDIEGTNCVYLLLLTDNPIAIDTYFTELCKLTTESPDFLNLLHNNFDLLLFKNKFGVSGLQQIFKNVTPERMRDILQYFKKFNFSLEKLFNLLYKTINISDLLLNNDFAKVIVFLQEMHSVAIMTENINLSSETKKLVYDFFMKFVQFFEQYRRL